MSTLIQSRSRKHIDWILLGIVTMLVAIGFINLYSASVADGAQHHVRQLMWIVLGVVTAALIGSQDYRLVARIAYPSLLVGVGLLILVAVAGTSINGSKRWIAFGDFSVQPSEFLKIAVVLVTAKYFSDHERPEGRTLRDLVRPAALVMIPSLLIINQPDLGTTLTLWLIFGTMCVFDRIRPSTTVLIIGSLLLALPLMWTFVMKDYQKDRVRAFLDPEAELQGDAWQVRQSRIAIGSGRIVGKGFLQGTQVQGGFVPYHENDFIFAHHGEQFGFLGSVLLLLLYTLLILWPLRIARFARDRFGALLCVGISALFFWHVAVNLAMVMGWLPVVGLWLPFASRGGTAMLTMMICVGILFSVSQRRRQFNS